MQTISLGVESSIQSSFPYHNSTNTSQSFNFICVRNSFISTSVLHSSSLSTVYIMYKPQLIHVPLSFQSIVDQYSSSITCLQVTASITIRPTFSCIINNNNLHPCSCVRTSSFIDIEVKAPPAPPMAVRRHLPDRGGATCGCGRHLPYKALQVMRRVETHVLAHEGATQRRHERHGAPPL